MTFIVEINTGNSAFQEFDQAGSEVARILKELASSVNGASEEDLKLYQGEKLRDSNGNTVGKVLIREV